MNSFFSSFLRQSKTNVTFSRKRWSSTVAQSLQPNRFNVTTENRFKILNSLICPWQTYSYKHQLSLLNKESFKCLRMLTVKLLNVTENVSHDENGLPCSLTATKGSPVLLEYRNKDELSIWPGIDGNPKTVGLIVGKPERESNVVCVEIDEVPVVKKSHKTIAKLFQDYIRNVSPLDICMSFSEGGHWHRFIIRSNDVGEHMIVAVLHPQELTEAELEDEKERLKKYFEPLAEEHNIKSVYFQASRNSRSSHEDAPFQLIFGQEMLQETFRDLNFHVKPETYFPVNKAGREVLFKTMFDELDLSPHHILIDLCCGIGLFSLLAAPHVQRVIGIDRSRLAVEEATKHACINGIKNCTFIPGMSAEILPRLENDLWDKKVIVVGTPPRDGFPVGVMSYLRSMNCVKRFVYVSNNPGDKGLRNFFHLMVPERKKDNIEGPPFIAVNATPVSVMPHTMTVDLVVTFERAFF